MQPANDAPTGHKEDNIGHLCQQALGVFATSSAQRPGRLAYRFTHTKIALPETPSQGVIVW